MTIAELLVHEAGRNWRHGQTFSQCLSNARRIVAAIYGEPCDGTSTYRYADPDPWHEHVVPVDAELPSNVCRFCGWPRSMHGGRDGKA